MDILTCPHCQTRVVLTTAGQCPSCRTSVALVAVQVEEKASPPPPDLMVFVEKSFPSTELNPPSENPYQAPQFTEGKVQRSGLLWVLFSFEGRIPRRYYWGAQFGMIACFYAFVFVWANITQEAQPVFQIGTIGAYLLLLWSNLATTVKRLHDRNKSGIFVLVGFIPIFGGLFLLVEAGCLRGTHGWNQFGSDPT